MMSLSDDKQADVIDAFNTTSRYLEHILPFQGVTSFVDLLCFSVLCLLCLCARLFICILWSPT